LRQLSLEKLQHLKVLVPLRQCLLLLLLLLLLIQQVRQGEGI